VSVNNALLGATARHLLPDDFSDEMRLDSHRVTTRMWTRVDAKYKDRATELVKAANFLPGSGDVFENCLGLLAIGIPHTAEVRDAEDANDVAFANGSTVNILDACWLGGRHGT
jgi:hypothetical protein